MMKTYKVWVEVEEYDSEVDMYTTRVCLQVAGEYTNEEKATEEVERVFRLAQGE